MKKVRFILFAAIAGLLAVSCTKEVNREVLPDETNSPIHFHAIANAVDTRTAVLSDESFIKWLETDQLKIVETLTYTLDGEEKTANNTGSAVVASLSDQNKKAVFDATVTAGLPSGATLNSASYVAAYPAVIHSGDEQEDNLKIGGSNDNKFWRVNMPNTQYPGVGTFDPDADILLSAPASKDDNSRVTEGDELDFRFHRIGTAVKMTVKGLVTGEKLSKIVLTAPKNVAGLVKVDLSNGDYLASETNIPYSNGSKTITLKYDDLSINGDLIVWFRVLAGEWSGTLEIYAETDKADYYRTTAQETGITLSSPMVFADGGLTKFAVNMGVKRVAKEAGTVYTKVTKNDEIGEGASYIVAYLESDAATTATVMAPITGTNKYAGFVSDIAFANNAITIQNQQIQVVTLESAENEGEFYVKFGEKYLSCGSSNASLALNDNKLDTGYDIWQVSPSGIVNTMAKKTNNGTTTPFELQFNASSGSERFANYAGTMKAITLFKNGTVHVVPAIIPNPTSLSVGYQGVTDADDLSFSLKGLEGDLEVTCDETVVTEAVDVDNTIIYSVSANTGDARTGWIQIAVGEVSVKVTVNQSAAPTPDFTTVAQLNALAAADEATKTGTLTGAVISFVPDTQNAVIKDETGSILFYAGKDATHSYKQGQTFTGELTVNIKLYNGCAELTACNASFIGDETVVAPATVTLAQLVGNLSTYQNAYVKVVGLAVTDVNGQNISVKEGENTYVVYAPKDCPIVAGDIITVTGTVAHFGSNDQIKAWSLGAIVKTGHETVSSPVTINDPTQAGCAIKVKVNGSEIANGTTLAEGTAVTLEAIVGDGFTFNSWSVKKTNNANISVEVEDGEFEMPTYPVTISASFTSTSGGDKTYTITWNSNNNSASVSSYTASWNVTADGLTLAMQNWNNNSNKWNYVKAGRNGKASVATITSPAIPEAIKTVKLTIDAVTADKINSLKVYVSSSSDFSNATSYSFAVATGEKTVTLSNPSKNCYYKIEADCASGSSNGLIQVSKLVFTTE